MVYKKQIAVRIKPEIWNCEQEHNQLQCAFSTKCLEAHLHACLLDGKPANSQNNHCGEKLKVLFLQEEDT